MRKRARLFGVMAVMVSLALFTGCSDNKPADTNPQVESGSLEEAAPEPAMIDEVDEIPEDIAEFVRKSEGAFFALTGEQVSVDDMQVAQYIPSYVMTENGIEEHTEFWPVYVNGEMRFVVERVPGYGITMEVQFADYIVDASLDKMAIVYDNTTMYYSDGTQLIPAETFQEDSTRVPITEENEAEVIAACKLGRVGAIIGGVME